MFFGRDQEVRKVGEALREHRFAAVIGGSGSGKTSLLQAGVLPNWTIPGHGGVPSCTMHPGEDPFLALARLFFIPNDSADQLAAQLRDDPGLFGSVHKRYCQTKNIDSVLIAIEQFEELFTLPDREVRDFIGLIVQSLRGEGPGAERDGAPLPSFALTVRADFFHRCLEHPEFLELLQKGMVLVGEPSSDIVRYIVRSIATRIDLNLQETLVERLVRDTDALESGRLVMLGYMLRALYRDRHVGFAAATIKLYEQLGGIEGSIAHSAGLAFNNFEAPAQRKEAALQRLFAALVQVDTNGQPLRRRTRRAVFSVDDDVARLIKLFSAPDVALLHLSGEFVEITHEILFERYTAIRDWIDDNREELVVLASAEKAAREWLRAGRDADLLWPARKVTEARGKLAQAPAVHATLSSAAHDFLDPHRMVEAMTLELARADTDLPRRLAIGQALAARSGGDLRPGVAAGAGSTPDILWLPVAANPHIRVPIEEDFWVGRQVEAFQVSAYPVTCAQFQAFMAADSYDSDCWWGEVEHSRRVKPEFRLLGNCPAAPVTWHHAMAFARWAENRLRGERWPDVPNDWHVRLPTEWEWLQAATAGRDQAYPWGNDYASACARSSSEATQGGAVIPVGLFPAGASFCGALDMIGNALEWTLNQFVSESVGDHIGRPLRGGRLEQHRLNPCAFRKRLAQSAATPHDSGFRLVLSPGDPAALARRGLKD
jgi:formylglycine-generating enzyme required for sulfatase activity